MATDSKSKIRPPLRRLPIDTADSGFYNGFNKHVTITSKLAISALIIWAVVFPGPANKVLDNINANIIQTFSSWYVYATATFVIACALLAIIPQSGRMKLGLPDDEPEFSRFSWFAMMFGAGIGIGMLTYSTGEPIFHFQNNPDVIRGDVAAASPEVIRSAYQYSFLHWGLNPWAAYSLTGLALAYFAYRRSLPLTIRSSLAALFGRALSGPLGHAVDIVAVVATILGVAVTLGYGVEQFVAGLNRIGVGDWLLKEDRTASSAAIISALIVIIGGSTLSALSGVGKGIKWLSNINMTLSFGLLAFFLIFGSMLFSLRALGFGLFDYVTTLPRMMFHVASADGTQTGAELLQWQLDWTIFYWAWWVAFAPFVGMFLARISKRAFHSRVCFRDDHSPVGHVLHLVRAGRRYGDRP